MATTPTAVSPAIFEMSVSETLTVSLDATEYLSAGQSVADVVVTMTEVETDDVVTLPSSTLAGNAVLQKIPGSSLTADASYLLRVTFTATPSSDVWTMDLTVTAFP